MSSDLPFALMAAEWEVTTLGEVCSRGGGGIQTGPFGSQLHAEDYVTAGVPVIMPKDIVDGRVDVSAVAMIGQRDVARLNRHRVALGDIVYSRRGDIRRRALIGTRESGWLCGTGCLRVRLGSGAHPGFVATQLGHPSIQEWIERHAVGATMLNLNTGILSRVPLVLPDLDEQSRIAGVLAALDDKIESNRRLVALLEETAATLFRARFVDFAGVNALMNSEIGRVPTGWSCGSLLSIARFVNGKAFTKEANGAGRPILRIRELNNGVDEATPASDVAAADEHVARHHDILFAWSGSLGVRRWHGPEGLINQHIFKVLPIDGFPAWFVAAWVGEHLPEFKRIAAEKATTMGHIKREHLAAARLALPPMPFLEGSDATLRPLDEQISALAAESSTLAVIHDTLLPKLISGAIRVPDTVDPDEMIGPAAEALGA